MRYIVVERSNDYCGCDSEEYYAFPDDTPDAFIDNFIEDGMLEYAEAYEWVARGWGNDWESEEDKQWYYESCSFSWREATEEEIEDEVFYEV